MHLHFANSLLSNFSRQVYVSKRWWGDLWERIMLASFCQNFYTFYMNFADNFMRAYNVGIISCKIYIFTYFTDKFMFVCGDLLRRIMVEWFCAIACNCSRSLPALYGFHTIPANFFVRPKFIHITFPVWRLFNILLVVCQVLASSFCLFWSLFFWLFSRFFFFYCCKSSLDAEYTQMPSNLI